MLIAHLPAGYICQRFFKNRLMQIGILIGSILPDIDLIYFYTFGKRAILHHHYVTHMPIFWLCVTMLGIGFSFLIHKKYATVFIGLLIGTSLHVFLDTVTGHVQWFQPFSEKELRFFDVNNKYAHWILNFIFHWTFLIEITITLIAGFFLLRRNKQH